MWLLPQFNAINFWFRPRSFESERLYERLGALVLKRYVPTGGDLVMRRIRRHHPDGRWVTSSLQSLCHVHDALIRCVEDQDVAVAAHTFERVLGRITVDDDGIFRPLDRGGLSRDSNPPVPKIWPIIKANRAHWNTRLIATLPILLYPLIS